MMERNWRRRSHPHKNEAGDPIERSIKMAPVLAKAHAALDRAFDCLYREKPCEGRQRPGRAALRAVRGAHLGRLTGQTPRMTPHRRCASSLGRDAPCFCTSVVRYSLTESP